MKRKIKSVVPPTGTKKKRIIETSSPVPSTSKSYYKNPWNEIDVARPCRKSDNEDESDEETEDECSSDKEIEDQSVEETEDMVDSALKSHSKALEFTEQGNNYEQNKLYDSAIISYSKAIKIFPYNEIFFTNRALCYLKQYKLGFAEKDCTAALQLNDCNVKAYHERANIRIKLKDYVGAEQDIDRILSLEPTNKKAKSMLSKVYQILGKPKVAACRKFYDEDESDEETEDVLDSPLIRHSKALEFKEKGNSFKQMELYESAIDYYSKAINLFPYDEVFFSNRALCYLKQNKLGFAETDCTAALQLNDCNVKAYHERANIRIKLKDYVGAEQDIDRILSLETTKKEAKSMLSKVYQILGKSKPRVMSELSSNDILVKKKIGKKISYSYKLKQTEIQKQQMQEFPKLKKVRKSTKETITEITSESEQKPIEKLPDWIPKLDENYGIIVKPIELSVLKIIENLTKKRDKIKEPATPKIVEIKEKNPKKTSDNVRRISKESHENIKKRPKIEVISSDEIPSAPNHAVQFLMDWKRNESLQFRYSYLKQIPPEMMSTLFKESMESTVFEDIIIVLKEEFITKERNIFQYLEALSNIKRFKTLIMFIDRKAKEALKELFAHCRKEEDKSEQEIDRLQQKFEL